MLLQALYVGRRALLS